MEIRKCILVAPLVSHATAGRIEALINAGCSVSVVDVSTRDINFDLSLYPYSELKSIHYLNLSDLDSFYKSPSKLHMLKDLGRSYNIVDENANVTSNLSEIFEKENPQIVVTFYGPLGIHFSRILKKIRPDLKLVFIPNLIPSTLLSGSKLLKKMKKFIVNEFTDYNNWLSHVDFIFCASAEMSAFINKKFSYPLNQMEIIPDFHPVSFQVSRTSELIQPNSLIFLGAPERWGGQMDNIDLQLEEYSQKGIKVFASEMIGKGKKKSWFDYPFFSDNEVFIGKLSDYANQFSAALITYNISQPSERFRSTLPTRFLSALSAGLPIAVKGGLFDAVESFVLKYDIGFVFNDASDIREKLADKDKLQNYRNNLTSLLPKLCGKYQGEEISKVFDLLNSTH